MATNLTLRPALPGEGELAGRILRNGFPPAVLALTIWCSPRIGSYLDSMLARKADYRVYLLENEGDRPLGAIAIRRQAGRMCPLIMALDDAARGAGLGARMLHGGVRTFGAEFPATDVTWDVIVGQSHLERWYERLGGREIDRSWWWTLAANPQGKAVPLPVSGWEDALRQHEEWGFCSFHVQWNGSLVEVGRLPGPWFRVLSPQAAADEGFRAALRHMDPTRGVLQIGANTAPGAGWIQAVVARRLYYRYSALLEAFEARASRAAGEGGR